MTQEEMKVFDWDDEIENDGDEYVVLEEGDYDFEVYKFEKSFFTAKPDSKIPDCPMAIITLKVATDVGDAFITDRFYLVEKSEWRISSFFRAVGLKKHGEKLKMKWSESIGCKGKAHITKTKGTQNQDVWFNNVAKYIDPPKKEKGDDDTWS